MKSFFSKPATMAALALCVIFSIILTNRVLSRFGDSTTVSGDTISALGILPGNSVVTGMIDVSQTLKSDLIGFTDGGHFSLSDLSEEAAEALDEFAEHTGVNPATDIDKVYFSLAELEGKAQPSMLIYGSIDGRQAREFITDEIGGSLSESQYRDVKVYSIGPSSELSFAFVTDNLTIVSPQLESIHLMIDRINGAAPQANISSSLIAHVDGSNAWLTVNSIQRYTNEMVDLDDVDPRLALARRAIDDVAVSVQLSDDRVLFQSVLGATEKVSSSDLEDIVKGSIAAIRTASQSDHKRPIVAEMLDRVKVRKSGDVVVVSGTFKSEDIEQLKALSKNSH